MRTNRWRTGYSLFKSNKYCYFFQQIQMKDVCLPSGEKNWNTYMIWYGSHLSMLARCYWDNFLVLSSVFYMDLSGTALRSSGYCQSFYNVLFWDHFASRHLCMTFQSFVLCLWTFSVNPQGRLRNALCNLQKCISGIPKD